jgi:hypothetical protein
MHNEVLEEQERGRARERGRVRGGRVKGRIITNKRK